MNPIALIFDSQTAHRFSLFAPQVLYQEGFTCIDCIDTNRVDITDEIFSSYACIIVAYGARIDWALAASYVKKGGSLVAFRPPRHTDSLFGLARVPGDETTQYIKTRDPYVVIQKKHHFGQLRRVDFIQSVGEADLYESDGAVFLANLSSVPDATHASVYGAVSVFEHGKGRAAAFSYDIAACIASLHQGDPSLQSEGDLGDALSDQKYTAGDLFKDRLDYDLAMIPQADVHADLLTDVLMRLMQDRFPLPRLWHYPFGAPSVAWMNGDSDGMTEQEYEAVISVMEKYNAPYTCYIMQSDFSAVSPKRAKALRLRGHDFGPHFYCGKMPTLQQMQKEIQTVTASFIEHYKYAPTCHRCHGVVWVGYTEMAQALSEAGIRMDTNFTCGIGLGKGFLNGSGLPVRFITPEGEILDVYEQSTQLTDDGPFSPKMLMKTHSHEQVENMTLDLMQTCVDTHSVFHPYYHPRAAGARSFGTMDIIEKALARWHSLDLPFVSGRQWLTFNDAIRSLRYDQCSYEPSNGRLVLRAVADESAQGVTWMFPTSCAGKRCTAIFMNGHAVKYTIGRELEGLPKVIVFADIKKDQPLTMEILYE